MLIFKAELVVSGLPATANIFREELVLEDRTGKYPMALEFSVKLQSMLTVPGLK